MLETVRLIFNNAVFALHVHQQMTFLDCLKHFSQRLSTQNNIYQPNAFVLKYKGIILQESDKVNILGNENSYDIYVELKNPPQLPPQPKLDKASAASSSSEKRKENGKQNLFEINIISFLTRTRYVQPVSVSTTIADIINNLHESIKAEGEIVMFSESKLLYPLATIQSLSLENGDFLFFLLIPKELKAVLPYTGVVFENSNSYQIQDSILSNRPSILSYFHIQYYVETADNFFDFLKSILNLSRNYLKKLTISDEISYMEIVPSPSCLKDSQLTQFQEIILPWYIFDQVKPSLFFMRLNKEYSTFNMIQFLLFLVDDNRIKTLSDQLRSVYDAGSYSGLVLLNGELFNTAVVNMKKKPYYEDREGEKEKKEKEEERLKKRLAEEKGKWNNEIAEEKGKWKKREKEYKVLIESQKSEIVKLKEELTKNLEAMKEKEKSFVSIQEKMKVESEKYQKEIEMKTKESLERQAEINRLQKFLENQTKLVDEMKKKAESASLSSSSISSSMPSVSNQDTLVLQQVLEVIEKNIQSIHLLSISATETLRILYNVRNTCRSLSSVAGIILSKGSQGTGKIDFLNDIQSIRGDSAQLEVSVNQAISSVEKGILINEKKVTEETVNVRVMINQHIPNTMMKQSNQQQGFSSSSSSLPSSRNMKDQHDYYSSSTQSNHYYHNDRYDRGNSREYNDRRTSREYNNRGTPREYNSYSHDRYNSYSHDHGDSRDRYDSYSYSSKRQRL